MSRAASLFTSALLCASAMGCSIGQGTGDVKSDHLFARDCWGHAVSDTKADGAGYDMAPDFFAATPFRDTLQIRVQRGTDYTEVSDGLWVTIDDVKKVRAALAGKGKAGDGEVSIDAGADGGTSDAGTSDAGAVSKSTSKGATFSVALTPGIIPPGSPSQPPQALIDNPPIVHMALYLQRSCHNQNIVLYAVSGTITFTAVFDGDPNETQADEKLTDATFDVQVGDIRDTPFGEYAGDVPPGLQSRVTGSFRFYFERGQPAQPFP